MRVPEKRENENLVEYAWRLSELYSSKCEARTRKIKGQFFTPAEVSRFMASLFQVTGSAIRLLDPGAGTGVLTAAFCERLIESRGTANLTIDAYENDPNLLPFLRAVLETCKIELEARGHKVTHNVHEHDFILHNEGYLTRSGLFWESDKRASYDYAISNPPYYKLNKNSPQSVAMGDMVSGQPNIYALFIALTVGMMKPEGEIVFITPRSFCSGLYYKKFREWFLRSTRVSNIHIFESRKKVFDSDGVLQENVIVKAVKGSGHKSDKLVISFSKDRNFSDVRRIEVESDEAIFKRNGETFIGVPTSSVDVRILRMIDRWPNTLKDFGIEISTGPVVPFRAAEYLLSKSTGTAQSAPLLWMHNMQGIRVVWPLSKNKKESAIRVCEGSMPLLLPVKNYVLLKRFSSKEQKRRLYASVLLEDEFPHRFVGVENHVNYIHRPGGNLSIQEAFGIAAILNARIVDNFFRLLNGNTQVSATEIRSMPLPGIDDIRRIGEAVHDLMSHTNEIDWDRVVAEVLGTEVEIAGKQR
jgi:adenine-specific DNA-methyltransferase